VRHLYNLEALMTEIKGNMTMSETVIFKNVMLVRLILSLLVLC